MSGVFYPAVLGNRLGVGVELGVHTRKSTITYETLPGTTAQTRRINAKTAFVTGVVMLHPFARRIASPLDPYAVLGVGWASASATDIDPASAAHFGAGAGVEWAFTRQFGLTIDVRWVRTRFAREDLVFNLFGDADVLATRSPEDFLVIGAGLNFMLRPARR